MEKEPLSGESLPQGQTDGSDEAMDTEDVVRRLEALMQSLMPDQAALQEQARHIEAMREAFLKEFGSEGEELPDYTDDDKD